MKFDELLQHRQTTCLRSSRWPSIINVNSSNGGVSSICVAAAIYTLKIHSKFPVYFFPPLCCAAKWGRMAFKSPVSRWAKWTKWKWFWMHYFFFFLHHFMFYAKQNVTTFAEYMNVVCHSLPEQWIIDRALEAALSAFYALLRQLSQNFNSSTVFRGT